MILSEIDFVPMRKEITTRYAAGKEKEITLHDGSVIHLHKTSESYDPMTGKVLCITSTNTRSRGR